MDKKQQRFVWQRTRKTTRSSSHVKKNTIIITRFNGKYFNV